MSIAIKATNSRGLKIINCSFQGFDTDIELDNVEDFISQRNTFSTAPPNYLLSELVHSIETSHMPHDDKRELFEEIITFLSRGSRDKNLEDKLVNRITYIGNKAVDYFVQLASAVSAGLVLRRI